MTSGRPRPLQPRADMASTGSRRRVQGTRRHDNLYDPIYQSSSGAKDHYAKYNAAMMKSSAKTVPLYDTMFSDHRPNKTVTFRQPMKGGMPAMPPDGAPHREIGDPEHNRLGRDRYKYVKRPNVPFLHSAAPQVVLAGRGSAAAAVAEAPRIQQPTPRTKTVAVQTQYRDSETQTDPYTPDYTLADDAPEPEVLSIAHFSHANGMLPAARHEVEVIQRMRAKREFLSKLPEIDDTQEAVEETLEKRRNMLAEQEGKEWKYRVQEMMKEQEAKLETLVSKLRKREAKSQEYLNRRLDVLRQAKAKQRSDAFRKVHADRTKGFRKIGKLKGLRKRAPKRDVIEEYADHQSAVYAPVARVGKLAAKNAVVDYGIPLIQDFQGLETLESRIPAKALRDGAPPKPDVERRLNRREKATEAALQLVDRQVSGMDALTTDDEFENVYKKIQPIVRPRTPVAEEDLDEEVDAAAALIQRLMRGRAVQNEMFESKERFAPLIEELQLEEELQRVEAAAEKKKNAGAQAAQRDLAKDVDLITGAIVAGTLDFLAKRVVQQREQRKIEALAQEAERERARREAEEAGRRQAEAARSAKLDQASKVVIGTHQNTVDSFIDQIVARAEESVAQVAAADAAKRVAEESKRGGSEKNARAVAEELVFGFLIPEVERRRKKSEADVKEARFARAAEDAAAEAVQKVQNSIKEGPASST